jgi:UDP-glucuronate 4-epimerase
MLAAMRYLVTGAAGFIGSHLTDALLAAGHDVAAVDCFTDYYDRALKEANAAAFPVEVVDLTTDPIDLSAVDGVFHLAGRPGARSFGQGFRPYLEETLLASQRVFEAAAAAGVRVVFSSSSSVYGNAASYPTPESSVPAPRAPYGLTKLACEQLADVYQAEQGLDAVILRYFTVYGPRQRPDMFLARVIDALLTAKDMAVFGDGAQSRSFTYVDDVVGATVTAMEGAEAGSVYNVGGGQEATVNEAIALLEGIAGRPVRVTHEPRSAGDVTRTNAEIGRIKADLGWEPAVTLVDGFRAQWEWTVARSVGDLERAAAR